jgi:hypothetical protein
MRGVVVVIATSFAIVLVTASASARTTATPYGAPSPTAATTAFGRWLQDTYGNVLGYWTCPLGQTNGQQISCLAEVHVGRTWHMTSANATLSGSRVTFPKNYDTSWVRHWSPYSKHYLVRGGGYTVPGLISVNGPAYDWAWLALGARAYWKHHRTFHLDGLDGMGKGLMRFYDFTCAVQQNMVSCHNVFGDALRYIVSN